MNNVKTLKYHVLIHCPLDLNFVSIKCILLYIACVHDQKSSIILVLTSDINSILIIQLLVCLCPFVKVNELAQVAVQILRV